METKEKEPKHEENVVLIFIFMVTGAVKFYFIANRN